LQARSRNEKSADDGTAFFCTNAEVDGSTGIALSVINPVTGALRSPVRHICAGTGGRWPEAPHLYKFDGLYYLMLAEGGTEYGHMETLFRSESPWGPYTPCPTNPVLSHRDAVSNPVQCTGHADIVDDGAGNLWAVFLGVRTLPGVLLHNLGRETFLSPVVQDAAGWFSIGNGGIVGLEMEGPLPGEARPYTRDWKPSYNRRKKRPALVLCSRFQCFPDSLRLHRRCCPPGLRTGYFYSVGIVRACAPASGRLFVRVFGACGISCADIRCGRELWQELRRAGRLDGVL